MKRKIQEILEKLSVDETADLGAECINELSHDMLAELFDKVDKDQAVECHGILTGILDDMDGDNP